MSPSEKKPCRIMPKMSSVTDTGSGGERETAFQLGPHRVNAREQRRPLRTPPKKNNHLQMRVYIYMEESERQKTD